MQTMDFIYSHGEQVLHGYLASENHGKPRPAVIVVHDWSGRNAFACQKAELLASMGYVGFAVDMFGNGKLGETTDEKQALIEPLFADRRLLLGRMRVALDAIRAHAEVDENRIAVIGFCFGGLCALDLARSGADILGTVSFHGLLNRPDPLPTNRIRSKILALHGYDDPMVTPDQVNLFCQEMTEAGADWQMHMYGHTKHAFTNPNAHDTSLGTIYDAKAEHRSLQAMSNFLQEIFT